MRTIFKSSRGMKRGNSSYSPSWSSSASMIIFTAFCIVGVYILTSSSSPSSLLSPSPPADLSSPRLVLTDRQLELNDGSAYEENLGKPLQNESGSSEERIVIQDQIGGNTGNSTDEDQEKQEVTDQNPIEQNQKKPNLQDNEAKLVESEDRETHTEYPLAERNRRDEIGQWDRPNEDDEQQNPNPSDIASLPKYDWHLCNVTAGPDYIPCLDNEKAVKKLHSLKHYEHRERHCPDESPTCLVSLPKGYRRSIEWPASRDKIWYNNVPRTKLADVKKRQNWVKVDGDYLTFPGGGTQFIHGALHYIDFIQQAQSDIKWGKHARVILDVGCGVASFGGYLFERGVLAISFAPKDEHEAQVQFALERGIPAISAVMGSQRLPFPSNVFDLVHCARCRVPWHADGGMLLLELNRVLRPGGYFVWSATPVYQKIKVDADIWKEMTALTISMCWDLVTIKKDKLNGVAAAIYRKPNTNECYYSRKNSIPLMCEEEDDPNSAWYTPLIACMHRVPVDVAVRGAKWPMEWPKRLSAPPYWLNGSLTGIFDKSEPLDFKADYEHWKQIVANSYLNGLGIKWSKVRNVMDMRSVYGGFAAALKDLKVWVMNVVDVDSPNTLPIIYDRGLFGIYHDWCESFSTYPRTYDLLHADHLFSKLQDRCSIAPVMVEIDRIMRPGGKLIVRDDAEAITEAESLLKSLHWEIQLTFTQHSGALLTAEKSDWRPDKYSDQSF